MKTSQNGIDLIKKFEGCRLKAYKCPANVWTIGYGHTKGVEPYEIITLAEAEELLRKDLEKYESNVEKYRLRYGWNQNEFDALVSFSFNMGSIDKLTANGTRSKEVIAEKMLLYNKAGRNELEGLTKRRQAERELFLKKTQVAPVQQYTSNKKTDGTGPIRAVQQWLNKEYGTYIKKCKACGYSLLETDGKNGSKTKAALTIALQVWLNDFEDVSLKVDGEFGAKTKAACKVVSITINAYSRGAQIVQAILFCNKYNPQLFDEAFTKNCEKALKQYQDEHGLKDDGIAGRLFFESALS